MKLKRKKPKEGDAKALDGAIEPNDAGSLDGTNMATRALELASGNDAWLPNLTKPNPPPKNNKSLVKKDPGPLF